MNFITRIQNSDEATRKRWVVVLSGVTMAAVIALWAVYFNLNVARLPAGEAGLPGNAPVNAQASSGSDFNEVLKNGFRAIMDKIGLKNSVTISNSERNFILEKLEKIPAQKLP